MEIFLWQKAQPLSYHLRRIMHASKWICWWRSMVVLLGYQTIPMPDRDSYELLLNFQILPVNSWTNFLLRDDKRMPSWPFSLHRSYNHNNNNSKTIFCVCVGGSSIHNLITHAYIPDDYVPHIINIDSTGQKLYEEYVLERINRYMSLWDTVKK